jgi:hypothetical protein
VREHSRDLFEVCGLRKANVDLDGGLITVRSSYGKG